MSSHHKYIVGNWKMNSSTKHVHEFCSQLKHLFINYDVKNVTTIISPPTLYLHHAISILNQTGVKFCAQNVSHFDKSSGAYTGETSAEMLKDCGCDYVIIGHSERRKYNGENGKVLAQKIKNALALGLKPIYCIGEDESAKQREKAFMRLEYQLEEIYSDDLDYSKLMIAYEPVWSIGTGVTPELEDINSNTAHIFSVLSDLQTIIKFNSMANILYGGSVNKFNCAELLSCYQLSGLLIGGASLDYNQLWDIIEVASGNLAINNSM